MFAVFPIVRQLHVLLWYLDDVAARPQAAPIRAELERAYAETEALTAASPEEILTRMSTHTARRSCRFSPAPVSWSGRDRDLDSCHRTSSRESILWGRTWPEPTSAVRICAARGSSVRICVMLPVPRRCARCRLPRCGTRRSQPCYDALPDPVSGQRSAGGCFDGTSRIPHTTLSLANLAVARSHFRPQKARSPEFWVHKCDLGRGQSWNFSPRASFSMNVLIRLARVSGRLASWTR